MFPLKTGSCRPAPSSRPGSPRPISSESEYEITARIDYPQGGRCILRLVFLDKYEEEAGTFLVREDHARFRCPLKTYSYRMELMNAGTSAFRFHSVTIQEVSDHDESRTV